MKEAAWYHAGLLFPMPEAYALQGIFNTSNYSKFLLFLQGRSETI